MTADPIELLELATNLALKLIDELRVLHGVVLDSSAKERVLAYVRIAVDEGVKYTHERSTRKTVRPGKGDRGGRGHAG